MNSAEVVHQERPATSAPLEDMISNVLLWVFTKEKMNITVNYYIPMP